MGKFSGLLSTAIFVGIVAFLIYLCCRTKRKGAVVQRSTGDNIQPPMAGVINGYHPAQGVVLGYPQSYPPPQEGLGFPPHMSEPQFNNGMANPYYNPTTTYSNVNNAYPLTGGGTPYPMNPSSNTPYPVNASGGMPMPMPHHPPVHVQNVQASAPYPTASAPMDMEDLPPAYHTVVGQPQQP